MKASRTIRGPRSPPSTASSERYTKPGCTCSRTLCNASVTRPCQVRQENVSQGSESKEHSPKDLESHEKALNASGTYPLDATNLRRLEQPSPSRHFPGPDLLHVNAENILVGKEQMSKSVLLMLFKFQSMLTISTLDIGAMSDLGQNWCGNAKHLDSRPQGRQDTIATTTIDIFVESEHPVFLAERILASGHLRMVFRS